MTVYSTVIPAFRSHGRNKVRRFLTRPGIEIGIASVFAMVAMGQGASSMVGKQIRSMGRNLLRVPPGALSNGGFSFGAGSITSRTPDDGTIMAKDIPAIAADHPSV